MLEAGHGEALADLGAPTWCDASLSGLSTSMSGGNSDGLVLDMMLEAGAEATGQAPSLSQPEFPLTHSFLVAFPSLPATSAAAAATAAATAAAAAAAAAVTAAPAAYRFSGTSGEPPIMQQAPCAANAPLLDQQHAAAPAANGDSAAAGFKRRGRPPHENGSYSRGYLALKRYRERQRSLLVDLKSEVAAKLDQLHILVARNEALRAREHVLQAYMSHNMPEELQPWNHTLADSQQQQWQQLQQQQLGPEAPLPAASKPQQIAFMSRYLAYVRHIKQHRLRRHGSVAPLRRGDPRQGEMRAIVDIAMTTPNEETYEIMTTNLETGRREALPADIWVQVARKLLLTPEQQARVLSAWLAFEAELAVLTAERDALRAQLAGIGHYLARQPTGALLRGGMGAGASAMEAGIGSVLLSDDHEDVLLALQANMKREEQRWHLLSWSFTYLVDEPNMAQICHLSYPYIPSISQVFAAYAAEVLGHKSEVLGYAPSA